MERTDWRLKGEWIKNCNCAFGCPCDFNARPTNGECKGLVAMHVAKGHFGEVSLDGLKLCGGRRLPRAAARGQRHTAGDHRRARLPAQRDALLAILSGRLRRGHDLHIFSLIVSNPLQPIFAPIAFDFDMPGRRAKLSIPGVLETENEPIRNPVTGAEHRIQIVMPEGFEHRGARCAARASPARATSVTR